MSEKKYNVNVAPYIEAMEALGEAWNKFLKLHSHQLTGRNTAEFLIEDRNDFRKAIHQAQRIVIHKALLDLDEEDLKTFKGILRK